MQKFLSQPFHVAENFTGISGKYVPLSETIRGFRGDSARRYGPLSGKRIFQYGAIDEVKEKAAKM